MADGRAYLKSIIEQAIAMMDWSDNELAVVAPQLRVIDDRMPSRGDFYCRACSQKLDVNDRKRDRPRATGYVADDRNAYECARTAGLGHIPELVV